MPKVTRWWVIKPLVLLACMIPLAWITRAILREYQGLPSGLSANPIKDVTEFTGIWTLRFLMITLAITPVRKLTGWSSLIRVRRMLGLFTFFHAFIHWMTYVWLDQFFMWEEIAKDIVKRPFITSGMAAFVFMIPLAITSTKKWIGRLGGKRWQMLHRLIYLSGVGGVIHYYFFVKSDIEDPIAYGALLAVLLGIRGWFAIQARKSAMMNVGCFYGLF